MSLQRILSALPSLALAVVVIVSNPSPAHSAPTSRLGVLENAPRIMNEAADLAAAPASSAPAAQDQLQTNHRPAPMVNLTARPQREVFGFVNAGNLGSSSVGFSSWDFRLLTTVAFFGLHVNSGDGNLVTYDTAWAVYHSSTMSTFVAAAHSWGVRVIVSINLHDFGTSPTNAVCQGLIPSNAQNTINQAVAQVNAAGIDGINVNYEGTNVTCANGQTSRDEMVAFVQNLRTAMPSGYIAIDTYSGSAEDNLEFFNVTGLAPYVNAMFVMAYDMDDSNYAEAPLYCAHYCFNPVSPLNTYRFNVTKSMAQYTALVPASKVILGQPYYGRAGCVGYLNGPPHQYPIPGYNFATPTYLNEATVNGSPDVSNFTGHRDDFDHTSRWDSWSDTTFQCSMEQYWDDVVSLGLKYDLVNQDNLAGVGLFTLDYAGGATEVWNELAMKFSLIPGAPQSLSVCPGNSSIAVSWTGAATAGGPISSYQVEATPGNAIVTVPAGTTMATLTGLTPGTAYTVRVRAVNNSGAGVGATSGSITPLSSPPLSTSYFTWLDRASPGANADTIHIVNPGSTPSTGCATMAGLWVSPFSVDPGHDIFLSFPGGIIGGPVAVSVNTGPAVLADKRTWYYSSLSENWARPASVGATTQYFPWYDLSSPGMRADTIHITNVSGSAASGTIALPGATSLTFNVATGQDSYFSFPYGTIGGPVTITSGQPVLASLRAWYYQSISEAPGLTTNDAATALYLPWYDLASAGMRADTIHITNVSGTAATGTIALPGATSIPFNVASGKDAYFAFPGGTIGGPVTITSNQPVLAMLRAWYYQSFNEAAARPATAAGTTEYFAWYDLSSPGMRAQTIHITNVSGSPATGSIVLGGASISFNVASGQDSYFAFPGGSIGGPVTVTSNVPVLASLRAWYYQSFNEVRPG